MAAPAAPHAAFVLVGDTASQVGPVRLEMGLSRGEDLPDGACRQDRARIHKWPKGRWCVIAPRLRRPAAVLALACSPIEFLDHRVDFRESHAVLYRGRKHTKMPNFFA